MLILNTKKLLQSIYLKNIIINLKSYATENLECWPSSKIRSSFIDYFIQKDHLFVPSSSVLPKQCEGSYFVNAGMNQFKPIFLGSVDLNSEMASYKRVANHQKCIRVGGKHNDLEEVGHDLYHHTFFEMLGNWSFGDYSKKEACIMAWELLTKVYKLPASRLYITYFGGRQEYGLEPDRECQEIWKEIGISDSRILPFGMKDNFWVMGSTGPCGPCTEIHYNYNNENLPNSASLVNMGHRDLMEIWNIVFIEYDRQLNSCLKKLPQTHIDTGMGLERLASILQKKRSNYDTDLFRNIIQQTENAASLNGTDRYRGELDNSLDVAYRIIADHIRMATIAISDGLLPGRKDSEGKLRQIVYRCLHETGKTLKCSGHFLESLVPCVVEILGEAYPELSRNQKMIEEVIRSTEERYIMSIGIGEKMIRKALRQYGDVRQLNGQQVLRIQEGEFGKAVSYDIISLLLSDLNIAIDKEGFDEALKQKLVKAPETGRPPSSSNVAKGNESSDETKNSYPSLLNRHDIGQMKLLEIYPTRDSLKYDYLYTDNKYIFSPIPATIKAIKMGDKFVNSAIQGQECGLILDQTNFYAEAGGQISDIGTFKSLTQKGGSEGHKHAGNRRRDCKGKSRMEDGHRKSNPYEDTITGKGKINDCHSFNGYILHRITLEEGRICVGDVILLSINKKRRIECMANHTTTHILQYAINKILGTRIKQRGSYVADEYLTFDFTSVQVSISIKEIEKIEKLCNNVINQGYAVKRTVMPLGDAKKLNGVVFLDNHEYPNEVQVISIENPEDVAERNNNNKILTNSEMDYSIELCGGTHVSNTKDLKSMVITNFEGSLQGTKRITAVSRDYATKTIENFSLLHDKIIEANQKSNIHEVIEVIGDIEKVLSSRIILPKIDREKLLEKLKILQFKTNREKNKFTLNNMKKELENELYLKREKDAACVISFPFMKSREVIEALKEISPVYPVLISSNVEGDSSIKSIIYCPENFSNFTPIDWAEHICSKLKKVSHFPPKGKYSKFTNIRVLLLEKSINNSSQDELLNHANKFLLKF